MHGTPTPFACTVAKGAQYIQKEKGAHTINPEGTWWAHMINIQ